MLQWRYGAYFERIRWKHCYRYLTPREKSRKWKSYSEPVMWSVIVAPLLVVKAMGGILQMLGSFVEEKTLL